MVRDLETRVQRDVCGDLEREEQKGDLGIGVFKERHGAVGRNGV